MSKDSEVQVKISASDGGLKSAFSEAGTVVSEFSHQVIEHAEAIKHAFEGIIVAFAVEKIIEGIKELEEKFSKLGEQINRTAQMTGLSTQAVQEFNFAVELTGGTAENATITLVRLERNMAEAASGTGKAAELFKNLGIEVKNSDGKLRDAGDVLGDLAEKFSQSSDGALKTAYAVELMGRSGAQMIPVLNQGRDGLEKINAELEKSGSKLTPKQVEKFEELHQAIEVLNKNWEGFKLAIADFFEPAAEKVVKWLTSITQSATSVIKSMGQLMPLFGNPGDSPGHGAPFHGSEEAEEKKKKDLAPLPVTRDRQAEADVKDDLKQQDQLRELLVVKNKLLAEDEIRTAQQKNKELLDLDQITNAEYLDRKLQLQQQLDAIDLKAAEDKQKSIQNDIVAYEKAGNDIIALKQKQAQQEEAIHHEIVMEASKDYLQLAKEVKSSFSDQLASVLDGTKSMKDAWGSLTQSILSDLSKIAARNVAEGLFGAFTGGAGGAGIASIFGGFLAGGGPADSGKGYVVGENGPEFFMPSTGGTVYNQDQMSKMGGTTIHMTVNTPNAQSFRQNIGQTMADMQAALRRSTRNA